MDEFYRHYKTNDFYEKTGTCTNENDEAEMVLYRKLNDTKVWCRPSTQFHGEVDDSYGNKVKRFQKYVPEQNTQ